MDCIGKACQPACGNLLHSVFLGVTRACRSILILPAERFLCGSAGGKVLVSTCLACIYFERILLAGTAEQTGSRLLRLRRRQQSTLISLYSSLIFLQPFKGFSFVTGFENLDYHVSCWCWISISYACSYFLGFLTVPQRMPPLEFHMEEQSAQAQNANHEATCSLQQPTSRSLLLASLSRGLNERQVWTNRPCGQRVRPFLWVRVQASTNRRHFRKDFMLHRKGKEWNRRNALAKGNGEALTKRTGKNKIKMTYRDSQNCMQNFTQELYSLIKRILNQRGVGGRRGDEKVRMGGIPRGHVFQVTCYPHRSFAQTASESLRAFFWPPLRSLHPAFRWL